MSQLLIVEDADSLREVLRSVLENEGHTVRAASSAEEALVLLKSSSFDCILADFKLPQKNGIELLNEVRKISAQVPYVIMTAFGSTEIAVEAMKQGANDFITKPFEPQILCSMLNEVIEHRRIIDRNLGARTRRKRSFITNNQAAESLMRQAHKVARVDTSVLILGESGTGKELVAHYIHEHSARKDKPFIAINCAALPADLLESEFFGYESGAFTGATQTRMGILEVASQGTIFLDEVGDMPVALQVKLLRALQEGEVKRIGGNKICKVSPRIICATNKNVEEALASGELREDFYYRIAVISLNVPPLRERPEDVELLLNYFVEYFCNTIGRKSLEIDKSARDLLINYTWPGNARELENVVERAVILADQRIMPEHLGISLNSAVSSMQQASMSLSEIAAQASRRAEIELITKVLAQTQGNKSKAAHILGVSYKTLLNKVKEYQLGSSAREEETSASRSLES